MPRTRWFIALLGLVALACSHRAPIAPSEQTETPVDVAATHPEASTGEYRATSNRRFDDVEHWKAVFDDAGRPAWQRPEALLEALDVTEGMRVADLGSGTGFFLPYLSRAVGGRGRVFALDVEPALVTYLRERVARERLDNVEVRATSPDAPSLAAASTDLLLIVDTYHHIDHRKEYLAAAAVVLTRGGRVAIVDWKAGQQPVGPRDEAHKVPAEQVIREMQSVGFRQVATLANLPYQYVLVFSR